MRLRVRPVPHRVELDADQGGQVRLLVADDDRLLDERRGLQGVLDLGRRDVLAAGGDDDVLDAVDDLDVGAVDPLADVAGVQPPVGVDGLGGLVRLVPVAGEDAGVAGEDLAGLLVDPEVDAGLRFADGAELDPPGSVDGGDRGVLGHPVDLVDDHADAEEELQHLGRDRRGARPGGADLAQPDAVAQGPEDQRVAEGVQDAAAGGVVAVVGDQVVTDGVRPSS